ncbi:hypothetical protein HD806DRAFT_543911 [Xylariaceae sp. AK1471]|nr:hypothetical protein HD806DRAFT_543911 [Xylariaceae sp. AK1471]
MTGAFFAIVGTLISHQGQPIPRWPSGITVNALVSIDIVIIKIVVGVVISQGLGQLKWAWFRAPQPLSDLGVFDDASRGWIGAINLLRLLRGRELMASLGATVLLLAAIVDPFGQQITRFYQCQRLDSSGARATINTTNFLSIGLGPFSQDGVSPLSLEMQLEILRTVFDRTEARVDFTCPSGNCTFPTNYKTMGFCNSCSDISNQVKVIRASNETYTNYSLPALTLTQDFAVETGSLAMSAIDGGSDLKFYSIAAWSSHASNQPCIEVNKETWACKGFELNSLNEVASVSEAGVWAEPEGDAVSRTIDVSCVNETEKGILQRDGYHFDESTAWLAFNVSWTMPANETYARIRRQCVYEYYQLHFYTLGIFMGEYFEGVAVSGYPNMLGTPHASSGPTTLLEIFNNGTVSFDSYKAVFDRMANALGVFSRQHPNNNATILNSIGYAKQIFGDVYIIETCVEVRWQWLAFPAVLCLLTVLFFVGMVTETRWTTNNEGGWHDYKTDALPLLFHGLERNTLDEHQVGVTTSSCLSAKARQLNVKFEKAGGTWKFVAV